jgi:proteasome accessory factor C
MSGRGPLGLEQKLPRLLSVLTWLATRSGEEVPITQLSNRFQIPESTLVADLEQIAMAGLPPYSADELFDLIVDDESGTVTVGVPRFVTRPLRLDAAEAFDLLVRARAAASFSDVDDTSSSPSQLPSPLQRALAKLEQHLGESGVDVSLDRPAVAVEFAEGIDDGDEFEIEHWSVSRQSMTERTIVPRLVFGDRGAWYVVADDGRSGEERVFRLDRVLGCARTGRSVGFRSVTPPDTSTWFDDDVAGAVIRLAPTARWVIERYPVRRVVELAGGGADVELAVVDERWLRALLLRLGTAAQVVSPTSWRDLASTAAAELLGARYADG